MPRKGSSILVVGAGTWGCSIALELARSGYTSVTVLDGEEVPSSIAAGNDINKIMEEGSQSGDDTDSAYAWNRLHEISTEAWLRDPVYKPYYHRTGYVMAACSGAAFSSLLEDVRGHEEEYQNVNSAEEFRRTMPEGVLTGDFPDWRGFWKRNGAGWLYAKAAVVAAKGEAQRLGVRFITGKEGEVVKLDFSDPSQLQGKHGRSALQSVWTADGTRHEAHTTIVANGANADSLLDFKYQLRPTAWTLAHIKMDPEEAALYKNLPVLFNIERGFFMELSAESHELKICDEHPGYINPIYSSQGDRIVGSEPFSKRQIPLESETRVRGFLRETMPRLAGRPFSFARICWDADTPDRMPLIDWHPDTPYDSGGGNLLLAVGGSGHCFKTMPAMGKVVMEFLEGKVDDKTRRAFRWRPETAANRDWWDVQDRWGGDNKVMNFADVEGWTSISY